MFDEQLSHFFNADEFAVIASINSSLVNGILESSLLTVNQVHCCQFKFTCAEAAIPEIKSKDDIKINDQVYQILEIKPDGTGLVSLHLELAV